MSSPRYNGWLGFSGWLGDISVTALSSTAALNYVDIPRDCYIESVEIAGTTSDVTEFTLGLWRDSGGDVAIVGQAVAGATVEATPGIATTTDTSARWKIDTDHHPIGGLSTEATSGEDASADQAASENATVEGKFIRIWYSLKTNGATVATLTRAVFNCRW